MAINFTKFIIMVICIQMITNLGLYAYSHPDEFNPNMATEKALSGKEMQTEQQDSSYWENIERSSATQQELTAGSAIGMFLTAFKFIGLALAPMFALVLVGAVELGKFGATEAIVFIIISLFQSFVWFILGKKIYDWIKNKDTN